MVSFYKDCPKKLDSSRKQKWRIVIDFRRLNEIIEDKYPLPNINYLLDKLESCQYFTSFDFVTGFHHIELEENDIEKNAFNTKNDQYVFLRMDFGLRNAPNLLLSIQNESV